MSLVRGINMFMPKEKLSWENQKGGKVEVGKVRNRVICPISEENAQWASQENEETKNHQQHDGHTQRNICVCICIYVIFLHM